ncbi:hypothetical protein MKQ70_31015 [Chitinophaga sedimenti]|uniref:hypothetical protein n=1 Tax=Chitinophaga sedimenti TaxID=2033606 RepID=UPI0020044DEB|nr:hypothetical protein [Chitinophaga sedimenti]MCK7559164.1 hypothetical protein [Chitinophaga sedimenti]
MDKANIAPRLSMSYKLDDKGQVSLAYGEFYQKPEQQYLRQRHDWITCAPRTTLLRTNAALRTIRFVQSYSTKNIMIS